VGPTNASGGSGGEIATPKILPPVYFVAALIAMYSLHRLVPGGTLIPAPYHWIGALVLLAGLVCAGRAAGRFRRVGTPVRPFERSTVLVTEGLYRYTRNPMYLGLTLMLVGIAVLLGSFSPFLLVPIFIWWIQRQFIEREEIFLEGIFGQEYLAYKTRVRRWL
jgi:protein-S-isoprenylcysteine O-methyltransferase Ste14